MNFEYVISGMTMGTGDLYYKPSTLQPYVSVFNDKISYMDDKYKNQNVSMLFNSHCEPKHGECIHDLMPSWCNLFADSGGLQLSRTKKGLTDEIKDKIYRHQAQYSDIGMIFDDIPTEFDGSNTGWSMKTSTAGRRFAKELIQEKANSTLANVKRQIQVFDAMESDTKVSLIVQGQDVDSYRQYIETIVNGLTDEELKRCASISLSSACSGTGFVNRMEMCYAVSEFQIPIELKKNIHLLGVGSHEMMTAFFVSPDYFSFVENLSYDSSTQANSWFFSRYRTQDWVNIDIDSPSRNYNREQIYNEQLIPSIGDIYNKNKDAFLTFGINSFDTLIEESTKWSSKNTERERLYNSPEGEDGSKLLPFFNQMQVVEHFMDRVDTLSNNPSSVDDRGLRQIKDWNMFTDWLGYQGTQDKLPTQFGGNLNEFFG